MNADLQRPVTTSTSPRWAPSHFSSDACGANETRVVTKANLGTLERGSVRATNKRTCTHDCAAMESEESGEGDESVLRTAPKSRLYIALRIMDLCVAQMRELGTMT